MQIVSPVFANNQKLPKKYGYHQQNVNPPLEIKQIPEKAKSLVLIVDDPDAPGGTWLHWLVFDIPVIDQIKEDSKPGTEGLNSDKTQAYGGPAPPSGTHRYFFKLYALDALLNLKPGSSLTEVEKAMQGHVLAKAEIIGLFSKN